MCSRIIKFTSIFIFVLFIFHGGCKSPFTPSETLPVIWVNAFSISFNCAEVGANPAPQILQVKNTGPNTLNYTIDDDANFYDVDWLTITPANGSSSGQIVEHTIVVDKAGMTSRDSAYNAKITISSSDAYNSPQKVDVSLKIEKEPPPEIDVLPQSLAFSAKQGAVSNPSSQTLRVRNTGQQSLNYTISDDVNWLDVAPKSGSSTGGENTHSVTVNIKGLSEGTYKSKITITDANASNSPKNVEVTLSVSQKPPPVISVTPASLSFSGKQGGANPASQSIRIKNSGEATLNYGISDNANWLSVNPTGGSSTGQEITHTVSVNIGGLGEGSYNGIITITDSNANNSPQTVGVTLTVSKNPPPEIGVSSTSLTFSGKEGGSNPSSQIVRIKNNGGETLNYSVTDDANWLSVNPASGSSTGQEIAHTVSANISNLSEGTYNGTITITDANAVNSPQKVGVTLTLSKQTPPQISVTPTSLTFSGKEGGSNPSSQVIRIKNSGEGSLDYNITDDAAWLSVSPTSGSSSGGEKTHTVSVNTGGLSNGTYTGTITISSSGASNSPQTVKVTLTISEKPPPVISVTPTSLTFSGKIGESDPSSQSIKIRNSSEGTLNYSITDNANWLSVNPTSGSSTGGENSHTVSVSISGLNEGSHTGTITITDSNASNSPQTVGVTLTLTQDQPPQISVTPTSLTFSAEQGGSDPSAQSIRIKNSGAQTLNYNITDDAAWLSVSPTSGNSTGGENTHTVSVNTGGLSNATYTGTITISSSGASNSPQTVKVTLTISEKPPPVISVTPASLTFSGKVGESDPSSKIIKISNSGEATLNYSITDNANWLSVNPTDGSSTGGENSHTVSVSIGSLSADTYTGTITITDPNAKNSPQIVNVTLIISEPPPPVISVTPTSLSFSAQQGDPNPSSKSIGIRNSGGQTLNYNISVSSSATWLSVSPDSGTSTGGENTHAVSVDISSLVAGDYSGSITISDSGGVADPKTVDVTLSIAPIPSNNKISVSCSPASGTPGTTITVTIAIDGNVNQISSFGLDLTYDPNVLDYQGYSVSGTLTDSWGSGVGANEKSEGTVRVGGYGGTNSIDAGSQGALIKIYLTVINCSTCSSGQHIDICIGSFADDIVGMITDPGCVTFTYNE